MILRVSLLRACATTFVLATIGLCARSSEASSISIFFGASGCGVVGDSNLSGDLLAVSSTCSANGTSTNFQAEGSLTSMRVAMDSDAVHNLGSPGLDGTGNGGAVTVGDFITINGGLAGSPGTLRVDWTIDGTLTTNGSGDFSIAVLDLFGLPVGGEWRGCGSLNLHCDGFDSVANETVSFSIPFVFGTPLQTVFALRGGTSGGAMSFYNTAQLQPFVILDSLGNLVSGASATSDSGFRYAVADVSAQVPEPASLLLLGTGLAAASVRGRIRNRYGSRQRNFGRAGVVDVSTVNFL